MSGLPHVASSPFHCQKTAQGCGTEGDVGGFDEESEVQEGFLTCTHLMTLDDVFVVLR